MRGVNSEDDIHRRDMMPPPPPPYQPRAMPIAPPPERHYTPYNDQKPKYDQLVIPPPMPIDDAQTEFPQDNFDRIHTASEIKPSLAVPNF